MSEDRSFSLQVKEELAQVAPTQECCQRVELAALLRACGRIAIMGQNRLACSLTTDHAPVARKIIRLIKGCFGLQTEVIVMRRHRLRKNLKYVVRVSPQPGLAQMLRETGVIDRDGNLAEGVDLPLLANDHCRRSYLRGTFLGTGWISAPERQHHLELTTSATEVADALGQLLFRYAIPIRMSYRKESLILYLKEADHIIRFLGLTGAHQSLLQYEDVRAMKGVKNLVNRQVNAETANLNKTVEASARQVEGLKRLQATGELQRLPESLRELALLRIEHTDASLKELGEMCSPPVGKSGINHRMRQLMKLAETLNS